MLYPNKIIVSSLIKYRLFSVSCFFKKSHYETLGVTPNANISDIKKAYYNLSLLYHPDKSGENEENLKKFRAVTEAYEVLSNIHTKKLYDRGVLRRTSVDSPPKPSSKRKITYVPQESGRTPLYDFETWSREHYGQTVLRRATAKQRYYDILQEKHSHEGNNRIRVILTGVVFFGGFMTILNFLEEDVDVPKNHKKEK